MKYPTDFLHAMPSSPNYRDKILQDSSCSKIKSAARERSQTPWMIRSSIQASTARLYAIKKLYMGNIHT